jgi:predicted enzyme related to lactoylglutathione lyase
MTPMTGDDTPEDALPHWHVTFSVDDTDATAERAVELGGAVVTPPFDAGPVRMAVVRDPQGAVFTISRYQPEE